MTQTLIALAPLVFLVATVDGGPHSAPGLENACTDSPPNVRGYGNIVV
jgi:hypothetical protein